MLSLRVGSNTRCTVGRLGFFIQIVLQMMSALRMQRMWLLCDILLDNVCILCICHAFVLSIYIFVSLTCKRTCVACRVSLEELC